MPNILPLLAVKERTAAKMLDLTTSRFLELVAAGALPHPCQITEGVKRWRVSDLEVVLNGKAATRHLEEEDFVI